MDTQTRRSRRALMATGATGGLSLALFAVGRGLPALAQETAPDATPAAIDGEAVLREIGERMDDFTHVWRATSPATHEGDTYRLTVVNASAVEQPLYLLTTIMDHQAHVTTPVVAEELTMGAGESRELTATNAYGDANHFQTTLLADTGLVAEIELLVVVEDAAAVETARFTEGAFLVSSIDELRADREARRADAGDGAIRDRLKRRRERRHADHDAMDGSTDGATPSATG